MFSRLMHVFQHEQKNVVIPTCIPSLHDAQTGTGSEKQRRENHRSSYKFGDQCVWAVTGTVHRHTVHTQSLCVDTGTVCTVSRRETHWWLFSAERKSLPLLWLLHRYATVTSVFGWMNTPVVKKFKKNLKKIQLTLIWSHLNSYMHHYNSSAS